MLFARVLPRRLIRISISEVDMTDFIGTDSAPGRYRIAQMLLAIVCGYPNVALLFLQLILKQSETPDRYTWTAFMAKCMTMHDADLDGGMAPSTAQKATGADGRRPKPRAKEAQPAPAAGSSRTPVGKPGRDEFGEEWRELCQTLSNHLDKGFVPEDLDNYFDVARRAARFSFSVSELPE